MKTCFLLLALLLPAFCTHAQDAPATAQADSLIKVTVMQNGKYSSSLYTINNEPITNTTLLTLLKKCPESAVILRKDRVRRRWALLITPVFLAGLIVGGIQVDKHPYEPGSNFSKAPVPFSIGLGAFAGSIALLAASSHFGEAIEAYNRYRHATK